MGYGKVNIWLRNHRWGIVEEKAHLHIYNCQGNQIRGHDFTKHIEIELPPGCYFLITGVYQRVGGNIYTEVSMVIVDCGVTKCINQLLCDYTRVESPLRHIFNCVYRIALPALIQSVRTGFDTEKVKDALNILAENANIDLKEMNEFLKHELDKNQDMKDLNKKEQDMSNDYKKLRRFIK